jgi:hypothetical protein
MKTIGISAAFIGMLFTTSVEAGCLAGAAVGGVAGHIAGHHALLGAAVGCAVGHHRAAEHKLDESHQSDQNAPK